VTVFGGVFDGLRILLTGHTGFKGSWLSLWLANLGAKVTGLSIDIPTTPSLFELTGVAGCIDHRFGDVRDAAAMAVLVREVQPDVVFHLAAQPLVRLSYREPLATVDTNVMGTANVLEAVRAWGGRCDIVVVTSDKCYRNDGRRAGYRETDPMGGHDPYSMSKGAAELVVDCWRSSYFSSPDSPIRLASARAGNVIGGGDWAEDRIITDCIAALTRGQPIGVRNPLATRPWQHVLEPLSGYLWLAHQLRAGAEVAQGWNFGPRQSNIRNVAQLVDELVKDWGSGSAIRLEEAGAPKEATALSLNIEKAWSELAWKPVWDFERTISETVSWYKAWTQGKQDLRRFTEDQIDTYILDAAGSSTGWAVDQRVEDPLR
jgi:CDP-glucose 4,6-dehydratase